MIQTRILMLDETRGVVLAFQLFGGPVLRRRRTIPERLATPFRRGHMVLADTLLVSLKPRIVPRRSAGGSKKEVGTGLRHPMRRYRGVKTRSGRLEASGGQARVADAASVRYTPGGAACHARNKRGG